MSPTAEVSTAVSSAPAPAPAGLSRALVTPFLDFLMLGGLSFITMVAVRVLMNSQDISNLLTSRVPWWAYYAAFAVNYPHFAYSYQLFYKGFWRRVRDPATGLQTRLRMIVAGFIAPAVLAGYFTLCYFLNEPVKMGYGVAGMLFLVGWHYVKQGYGVLITLSVYGKIFYGKWQKRILFGNAYAVWLCAWIRSNVYSVSNNYFGIFWTTANLPHWMLVPAAVVAVVTSLLSAGVLLKVWRSDRKGISFNGVVGYVSAIYLWVMFPYGNIAFFYFVPFFHSLQYLGFVYKFKLGESSQKSEAAAPDEPAPAEKKAGWVRWVPMAAFGILGVLLGGGFMDIIPKQIDRLHNAGMAFMGGNFFLVAFLLFINIHHYFIDNAFWRRDNAEVQRYLFRG